MSQDNTQVLSGLKIIEIGRDVSTAFAARFFAIYGAEVIVVEPPRGHELRMQPGERNPLLLILIMNLMSMLSKISYCHLMEF